MALAPKIAIVLAGRGLNTLVSLLFVPYLSRALLIDDYGTYGQTLFVTDFFKFIFSLGLAQIITVHFAKFRERPGQVLGSNLALGILSSLVAIALLSVFATPIAVWFENDALSPYLQLYMWSILLAVIFESINATLIYFDKIPQSVFALVIGNLFKVLFLVIAVQVYQSMTLIFCGLMAASLIQLLIAVLFLPKLKWSFSLDWLKAQFKDGLPVGLSGGASVLAATADSFMVSIMMGTSAYAVYRNGIIAVPFLDAIYYSVAMVIMPMLSKLYFDQNKKQIVQLKRRIITQSAALIYPPLIFILVFHYPLIVTYLSEKYVESAQIFFLFNLILFLRINYYQDLPLMAQKTGYILSTFLIGIILNIGLNYLLIPIYGLVGAVSATLLSTLLIMVLLFRKTITLLDTSFTALVDWKGILVVFLIPTVIMSTLWALYQFVPNLLLAIVAGGCGVLLSYFIYLRTGILEQHILLQLTSKLPFIGGFLKRVTDD